MSDTSITDPAEQFYLEGTQKVTAGRYLEAIDAFERALEVRPRESRYLLGLAAAVDRLGFMSYALSLAGQAADADTGSADAWFQMGLGHYRLGDYTSAAGCLKKAIVLFPDHAEAWFFLANSHYLAGNGEKSVECYDRLLAISGRYPKALYNKGVSLADLGRYEEAADAYRACLAMSPHVAVVQTNLGVALASLGQEDEALRLFDLALAADPRDPLTWHNKGLVLAKLGRDGEAAACFQKYRELTGSHHHGTVSGRVLR
ncbi:MAG: tetratricopeptide repeat protein [Methanoregula sp.]|jgi:tetratricopeptide (TPR) repeat protein|uniref:tetratricopeptide repeat protein n=1 Tax=Methanoregula sp. TaxID=2052170 RepID=UPI003C16F52E